MNTITLVIVACLALLQVQQAYSFFSAFQSNPSGPAHPEMQAHDEGDATQQHHHHHHQGGHNGGFQWNFQGNLGNMGNNIKKALFAKTQALSQHFGGMGFGGAPQNYLGNWIHSQINPPVLPVLHLVDARKEFYSQCGSATRQCEWVQKVKTMTNKLARAHHHAQAQVESGTDSAKPEMEYQCLSVSHVCVGNTENCVSNRTCDVAMKITELNIEIQGKPSASVVSSVSYLNNCNMEGQSVTDGSKQPQMVFGIGFTTHDEAGKILECRRPKVSDFKLVFLWKNSSMDESNKQNGHCSPVAEYRQVVHHHNAGIMNTIANWPTVCKGLENKEEAFSVKTFLASHAPVAQYTSSFGPPFEYLDNYEPQYSSNGMVISGVIN